MYEIIVNLHMHTRYSDGSGTHKDIAEAAIDAGVDAVIVTDHNVLVNGVAVLKDDEHTDARPGRALAGPGKTDR